MSTELHGDDQGESQSGSESKLEAVPRGSEMKLVKLSDSEDGRAQHENVKADGRNVGDDDVEKRDKDQRHDEAPRVEAARRTGKFP